MEGAATYFRAEAEYLKKGQIWKTSLPAQNWDAVLLAEGLTMAGQSMEKFF